MEQQPLILITNDDSIFAKGIKELVRIAKMLGEVVVVAPDKPQSGKSHSVSLDNPIWYRTSNIQEGVTGYKCTGTPVDCVKLALFKILKRKPDLILSGINHGSNSSSNIMYSGTMGAAIEGALHNIPSIGFSFTSFVNDEDFEKCEPFVKKIIEFALKTKLPEHICLNVNIPFEDPDNIKGIKITRQAKGHWVEDFQENKHPSNGKYYYWLTGNYYNDEIEANDTDEWALKNNYVSIQPVKIDYTDYQTIDFLKQNF